MSEQRWSDRLEELAHDAGQDIDPRGSIALVHWAALKAWADERQAAGKPLPQDNPRKTERAHPIYVCAYCKNPKNESDLLVGETLCVEGDKCKRISELEAQLAEAIQWLPELQQMYEVFRPENSPKNPREARQVLDNLRSWLADAEQERDSLKEQLAERESTQAQLSVTTGRLEGAYRDAESLREQLRPLEAIRQRLESMNACAANQDCGHCRKLLAGALASLPPPVAPEPAANIFCAQCPHALAEHIQSFGQGRCRALGCACPNFSEPPAQAQVEPEQPWNPQVNDYVRFKPGADTQRKADAGDTWRIRETITDGESVVAIKLKMRDGEYDLSLFEPAEPPEQHDPGRPHLIKGEFQSDKYPTCPRGKVPLSVKDKTAQDLLWEYAQRRRAVDAEFADDLEEALRIAGYERPESPETLAAIVNRRIGTAEGQSEVAAITRELDEARRALTEATRVPPESLRETIGAAQAQVEPERRGRCRDCGATSDDRGCIQHHVTCGHPLVRAQAPAPDVERALRFLQHGIALGERALLTTLRGDIREAIKALVGEPAAPSQKEGS